jgi:hypothetical protein
MPSPTIFRWHRTVDRQMVPDLADRLRLDRGRAGAGHSYGQTTYPVSSLRVELELEDDPVDFWAVVVGHGTHDREAHRGVEGDGAVVLG